MKKEDRTDLVTLDMNQPIWEHFYTVAPLVVIGTKEGEGYDLAPKHMAMPLGRENYYGFICLPAHSTWHNVKKEKAFTVSFPRPEQVTLTSLTASPRCGEATKAKPVLQGLPTFPAFQVDALFLKDAYLYLECELDRIIEGFGAFSLISGRIIGAYVQADSLKVADADAGAMIHQAPLLTYLAYGRFAEIKDSFAFPFPKDFHE